MGPRSLWRSPGYHSLEDYVVVAFFIWENVYNSNPGLSNSLDIIFALSSGPTGYDSLDLMG